MTSHLKIGDAIKIAVDTIKNVSTVEGGASPESLRVEAVLPPEEGDRPLCWTITLSYLLPADESELAPTPMEIAAAHLSPDRGFVPKPSNIRIERVVKVDFVDGEVRGIHQPRYN